MAEEIKIEDKDTLVLIIKKFFGQANILTIPRELIHYCDGDIYSALLLSQIFYWNDKTNEEWIFKSYNEWHDEIGMNEYEVRKAKKYLEEKGVIKTKLKKVKGAPTVHYSLDSLKFTESVLEFFKNRLLNNSTIHTAKTELTTITETTTKITKHKVRTEKRTVSEKLFSDCKVFFLEDYKNRKGEDYYFSGEDAGKLKCLIKKLKFTVESKLQRPGTDEDVFNAFKFFIEKNNDVWVLNHYSLGTLLSKYNEIIDGIKGQSKTANNVESAKKFVDRISKQAVA